jgi:hypothetical protein
MKLVHILNPVNVGEKSDLFLAQPITFESIKRALVNVPQGDEVKIQTCGYLEDSGVAKSWNQGFRVLDRSILDVSEFKKQRKLPLLADILDSVDEPFDYLIYTNVDIALMPSFYNVVCRRIREGYDGFVINRRTISTDFTFLSDMEMMYAQAGEIHPGLDCFVMSKKIAEALILEQTAIGITYIGKVLETNMRVHAERFSIFKQDHLTFHLGDDRTWKNPELDDYQEFNKAQFKKVMLDLLPIAEKKNDTDAIARVKQHLYKHFGWNEDGKNPFLNKEIPKKQRHPFSERIKRSIGALLGRY